MAQTPRPEQNYERIVKSDPDLTRSVGIAENPWYRLEEHFMCSFGQRRKQMQSKQVIGRSGSMSLMLGPRVAVLMAASAMLVPLRPAVAQSQATPGAPSVPLLPQALANGVANRITYQYNTEFVTVGNPGNANWNGLDQMRGNGGIGYEYRIGRTEINTTQWVAFLNAALARPSNDRIPWISVPSSWGARPDPFYSGPGRRFVVPAGNENLGVGDISWRAASIYCNWLHNNQQTSRQSFLNGAYDVSTYGGSGHVFTDQAAHSPGARFWIPTMGEWMKAAFFDPSNSQQVSQPGWWRYPNGSDVVPVYRAPEAGGGANAGFNSTTSGIDATRIPLMSYTNTQSPWGVMDLAGSTQEWTESIYRSSNGNLSRILLGSAWASPVDYFIDRLGTVGAGHPGDEGYFQGFRIAASIPSPSVGAAVFIIAAGLNARRRR